MTFEYITLSERFWGHSDPLKEAARLVDLYEEIVLNRAVPDTQILKDAMRILEPYSDLYENEEHSAAHCLMGRLYSARKDDENARRHLNTALRADPTSRDALALLIGASRGGNPAPSLRSNGFTLLKEYRVFNDVEVLDRALMLAHLALDHDTKNEADATYYLIASIHDARTQYRKGLNYLDVALTHNPAHESSLKLKSKLEEKLGGGDMDVHRSRRGEMPYIPSPAGSPIAEFMADINAMNPWNLNAPSFK